MFEEFKESQQIAYSLLANSIKNNKLSHAYLIDGNNNEYAFDFVMAFVKMIVCPHHSVNFDKCNGCSVCKRIDDGNYTEVRIIESDSLVIKKEQLLELQSEFSRTSIEGNKRVYIIKDCEKMNKQASNSLLKFLEEPLDGIVAILFTNHINSILSTIISRCQLIRLVKDRFVNQSNSLVNLAYLCCDNKKDIDNFLNDETKKDMINNIISVISYYEDNGLDIMIYLKKMWYSKFQDRDDVMMAILLMINFYYDVLKFKYEIGDYFFNDYLEYVERIAIINSLDRVIEKINICIEEREFLKYNLNVNLLVDKLFIRLAE